jgi:pimeloyl-ACP methyl ester carboxylesterase
MSRTATTCDMPRASAAEAKTTAILLHGSAASGSMWRETVRILQQSHHVVAPDLIGYGRSPAWRGETFGIDDEVAALENVLPCCGGPFHLVGYSYGGVVALALALRDPAPVLSLTLIEPVFFSALRHAGETDALGRLVALRQDFDALLRDGKREAAMARFIDFWAGDGAWTKLALPLRDGMLAMAAKIVLDWEASFAFDPHRDAVAALGPRTLLLQGDQSPQPMQRLVGGLHRLMPACTHRMIAGAGHLLPLSHSASIADAILEHATASPRPART